MKRRTRKLAALAWGLAAVGLVGSIASVVWASGTVPSSIGSPGCRTLGISCAPGHVGPAVAQVTAGTGAGAVPGVRPAKAVGTSSAGSGPAPAAAHVALTDTKTGKNKPRKRPPAVTSTVSAPPPADTSPPPVAPSVDPAPTSRPPGTPSTKPAPTSPPPSHGLVVAVASPQPVARVVVARTLPQRLGHVMAPAVPSRSPWRHAMAPAVSSTPWHAMAPAISSPPPRHALMAAPQLGGRGPPSWVRATVSANWSGSSHTWGGSQQTSVGSPFAATPPSGRPRRLTPPVPRDTLTVSAPAAPWRGTLG